MEAIGRKCHYFTMMRHPIDRLLSAFFYCPESGDKQARPDKVGRKRRSDSVKGHSLYFRCAG